MVGLRGEQHWNVIALQTAYPFSTSHMYRLQRCLRCIKRSEVLNKVALEKILGSTRRPLQLKAFFQIQIPEDNNPTRAHHYNCAIAYNCFFVCLNNTSSYLLAKSVRPSSTAKYPCIDLFQPCRRSPTSLLPLNLSQQDSQKTVCLLFRLVPREVMPSVCNVPLELTIGSKDMDLSAEASTVD